MQKAQEDTDAVKCEKEDKRMVVHFNHLFFSGKFNMGGFSPHMELVGRTHPWGKVGLRFKVLPKVLVTFEVAEIRLQGEGRQEEVGLLSLNTL